MSQKESEEWLLPKRAFGDCFGCAPHNTKGLKLQFWYTENGCVSYHSIPKEYCGFTGLAHGGIIATLLDEVAAWTIITHLFRIGITIQITVNYLKPIPTEEELVINAEILKHKGKKATVLAKIISKNGLILAEAKSEWLIPSNAFLQETTGINAQELDLFIKETIGLIQKKQRTRQND
ncbi:MAG: PaaI family thioesterase [Candidatus Hodarchaeales archaeon]